MKSWRDDKCDVTPGNGEQIWMLSELTKVMKVWTDGISGNRYDNGFTSKTFNSL